MSLKLKPEIEIGSNSPTFIIAEIGQNHQGDLEIAKELIKTAKECGADCVKFQKSCLPEKFTKSALNRPYVSQNSWGATYGEHKEFLEFSHSQFEELQLYAADLGVLFTASAMDPVSLEFLQQLQVPFIKIGSGDSNNPILLEKAAKTQIPLVISTGMLDNMDDISKIYDVVSKEHLNFALLHCVSSYPTPPVDMNLNIIKTMKYRFPNIVIGYSGHELGIVPTLAAVALGAKIVERHLTLDKTQKGSDHGCSLDPNQFKQMIVDIRLLEVAMGDGVKRFAPSEASCQEKLGKCVVAAKQLAIGQVLQAGDLKIKVAARRGVDGKFYPDLLGKSLKATLQQDETIQIDCVE